jgi:hypothetical protein
MTSTPSRSRYSASKYAAMRVSDVVGSGSGMAWMIVLMVVSRESEDFRVVELTKQLLF